MHPLILDRLLTGQATGTLSMSVRYGIIQSCEWSSFGKTSPNERLSSLLSEQFSNRKLHEIEDWAASLEAEDLDYELRALPTFLSRTFPRVLASGSPR